MMYRQITFAERYTLGLLWRRGLSSAAIARVLGRHRSTIGREVRRNTSHSDGRSYRPQLADRYARRRRTRSRPNSRFTAADWARVTALVRVTVPPRTATASTRGQTAGNDSRWSIRSIGK